MNTLRDYNFDFGIMAARTVPDGVMGSAHTANGLAVARDYPEDLRRYVHHTEGNVLIAGPNTAPYVLPQHGTRGRDVIIVGRHAPADAPYTAETLEEAFWSLRDGEFGEERKAVIVGGPNLVKGACEMVKTWNASCSKGLGLCAVLWLTEFYDIAEPRKYPAEPGMPVLDTLPENVREYRRVRQPNPVPGRPDFDFVSYSVR